MTVALPLSKGFAFKPHAVALFFFGIVPTIASTARIAFDNKLSSDHDKNEDKIQGLLGGVGMASGIVLTSLLQYFRYL